MQHRLDLIDFKYQQNYEYEYTRVDAVVAWGCKCSAGLSCVRVAESGIVITTGTRDVKDYIHTFPETDAIDCGD
jgi:hypothetical protein